MCHTRPIYSFPPLAALALFGAPIARAQAFEVASVKPSSPVSRGRGPVSASAGDPAGPTLKEAVQAQLVLKLES
jgi:hypothetical protein